MESAAPINTLLTLPPHGFVVPDTEGSLNGFFAPALEPQERTIAQFEGWILGVV
jgi:hypothetical protein